MHFAVSIGELERSFIAGFLEGEASLRIHEQNGGQSLACLMALNQRDDEQDMLEWLLATTGLGRLRRVAPRLTSKPQISWIVDRQDDCRELLAMIEPCGFHGRRAKEFRVWRQAVRVWTESDGLVLPSTRRRRGRSPAARSWPSSATCCGTRDSPGRKLREMEAWAVAVDELNRVVPRRDVLEAADERLRELRVYRPSQRSDLLRLPRRDIRAEALGTLTAWSRACPGKLTATDYARWRGARAGSAPSRNAIAQEFGSWHRALAAAGLTDRAATSAEMVDARQRGGAEHRATRREAQRTRVIVAVQRFEREHRRLPRAMEFFRWRLEAAVDAPTQGTVYRLFPGGWTEVLERARQVAGATV